jgi:hypothetical protein
LTAQSQAVDRVVRTLQQLVGAGSAAFEDAVVRRIAPPRKASSAAPTAAAKAAAPKPGKIAPPAAKPVPVTAGVLRPEDLIPLDDDFKNF